MARRFIAIEQSRDLVRVAVANSGKAGAFLQRVTSARLEEGASLAETVNRLMEEPLRVGDRMVTALPARTGLVRNLTFPFADEKKLAAALELELDAQLPVRLDDHLVAFRQLEKVAEGEYRVCAAAVSQQAIRETLQPFDAAHLPVGLLDLAPFGYADGLRGQLRDALLGIVHGNEISLLLIKEGKVRDSRFTPLPAGRLPQDLARQIGQQARSLLAAQRSGDLPLCLMGDGVQDQVLSALSDQGWNLAAVKLPGLERAPSSSDLPVAALALRACRPPKDRSFNFRTGPFTLKSEWRRLQRNLAIGGGMFLVATLLLAGSAWMNYAARSAQAENLLAQVKARFQASFPQEKAVVDPALQIKSKIAALQQQLQQLGGERQFTPLSTLRALSKQTPGDLQVDLRHFSFDADEVRVEGRTGSFDSIDRLAAGLEQSPLFSEVRIADAKLTLDGKQVDFRLTLSRTPMEVKP